MAILKIRDNEGVITNIATIKGENGKSPIIKNGTWWTYDDETGEYIDTGLGAEKESIVTKANVEKVLTGTIDSHNHDNVYVKEAPSDSKQYVRYNGEWNAIDLSSVNSYDATWVLNNTATQEQINELVDALNNKRRIIVEPIDPDVVVDGTDNIYIGITSQAENSFISIYIDKSTGNITYGYRMLPALDDVESIKVRSIDHVPTEDDIEFEYLYSNKTMPYTVGSTVYYNDKFYRLNSIVDGKADWRELVDANNTITKLTEEEFVFLTSLGSGTQLTEEEYNKIRLLFNNPKYISIGAEAVLICNKEENDYHIRITFQYTGTYTGQLAYTIDKKTKTIEVISTYLSYITASDRGIYLVSTAEENDKDIEEPISIQNDIELITTGNGTKYLADNGEYQTVIVPTKTSELTNDSGYLVNADIANLATKDEVSTKVDKVSGKGLSTNDYTTDEKNKLAGIAAGAEVNVNADWTATSGDAMIINKPTIPSKTSELTNDSNYITSSAVDTKISSAIASVYRVKGTVSNYSSLPTSNVTIGDVYNLSDTGANYVCTAISPITWDKLSETVDLSNYSTTAENDAKYQAKGNYITSIPTASSSTLGAIKTGYTTSTTNKNYAIQLDSNSNAYVNVPWTDNNTTYSAGTGISLSGTTFSNSGVRSITSGSSSNQLSVNTGGTTSTITINNVANAANATNATNAANATSASKLSTARNINIAGSVTGTASFDGSNNITINTTTNHIHKDSIKVADIDLNSLLIWATLDVAVDNFETIILANVNEGETGYFISRDASKTAVIKVTENSIEIKIQIQNALVSKTTVFTYNRADGTKTTSHNGLSFTLNGNGTKYLSNNGKYSDPCPSIKEMSDELYEAVNKLDSDVESTKSEGITYLSNNISENTKTYYFKNKITSADDKLFVSSYCIIIRNTSYNSSNVKDSDVIYVSYSGLYSWSNPNTYPIYGYSLIVDLINNTVVTNGGGIITSENGNATVLGVSEDKSYSYRLISDATIFKSMFNQFNSVNTLASLPVDKYGIQAKVTSATTLSFAGTPANGMEYMIDILNNSSSDIVQTLPNTGSYQSNAESITLPKGKVTSISVRYVFSKFIIKV